MDRAARLRRPEVGAGKRPVAAGPAAGKPGGVGGRGAGCGDRCASGVRNAGPAGARGAGPGSRGGGGRAAARAGQQPAGTGRYSASVRAGAAWAGPRAARLYGEAGQASRDAVAGLDKVAVAVRALGRARVVIETTRTGMSRQEATGSPGAWRDRRG